MDMNATLNVLTTLARQARAGDLAAVEQLRGHLKAGVAAVARQVLRTGGGSSQLEEALRPACARIDPGARDGQARAERVARRFCSDALAVLESPPRPRHADTVRAW
jgi:hypothetical protein